MSVSCNKLCLLLLVLWTHEEQTFVLYALRSLVVQLWNEGISPSTEHIAVQTCHTYHLYQTVMLSCDSQITRLQAPFHKHFKPFARICSLSKNRRKQFWASEEYLTCSERQSKLEKSRWRWSWTVARDGMKALITRKLDTSYAWITRR